MADAETHRQSTPTGDSVPTPFSSASGHEAKYIKPSDLLRPRGHSRPVAPTATHAPQKVERPIDRDERRALVRVERARRRPTPRLSLRNHTVYLEYRSANHVDSELIEGHPRLSEGAQKLRCASTQFQTDRLRHRTLDKRESEHTRPKWCVTTGGTMHPTHVWLIAW
jgi:hypothetical protein